MSDTPLMAIALACGGLAVMLTLASPRWGSYLFWFLTLMYPASALYAVLPLNIRFDDAFLVYLTLVCMRIAPPDVLTSRSFRMALLWFITVLLGNAVGVLTGPDYLRWAVLKVVGKALYVPMIVYVTNAIVRDEVELRRTLRVIMLASLGCMAIGVLQVYRPDGIARFWETPSDTLLVGTASETMGRMEETARRAGGSLGTSVLALTASVMSLLFLRLMAQVGTLGGKLRYAVATLLGMMSLGFTITRGAILGFGVALVYGILALPRRAGMVALMTVGLLFIVTQTDLADRLMSRVAGGESQSSLAHGAEVRFEVWKLYLSNFTVHYLLFGRGFNAEFVRLGGSAHNSILGAFAYTGMFGAVVLVWLIVKSWKMGKQLLRVDSDPYYRAVGESLLLAIVCMLVNGLTNELWQLPQIIYFALVALVDIRLRSLETTPQQFPAYALEYTRSKMPAAWQPAASAVQPARAR